MKNCNLLLLILAFSFIFLLYFFMPATAQAEPGGQCIVCHSREDTMPGLYKEYLSSKHSKEGITCIDCHGAVKGSPSAFKHYNEFISIIVSPNKCKRCHEIEVLQFNESAHYRARELVTKGFGAYFLNHIAGSPHFRENRLKEAPGTNGCLRCHGSDIRMNPKKPGHPTPDTWPNSGIGRKNPDGSTGNCAACHERHEFSIAQARRPESCANCHNREGGDPQYEAYTTSRHGKTYYSETDQMNLNSEEWIAGKDYFAAPTCATCHMSATINMKATHNINERLDWNTLLQHTNALAVKEKCGLPFDIDYDQPKVKSERRANMENVCLACHSSIFTNNFFDQYISEVEYFKEKRLVPGKQLFLAATKVYEAVEGDGYQFFTHSLDYTWWGMCNGNTKAAHSGAAMMSPGLVEQGNGDVASAWYTGFIPQVYGLMKEYEGDKDVGEEVKKAVKELKRVYHKLKKEPLYGPWPYFKEE